MLTFADDINMFWNVGYTADRQNAHDDLIKVDGLKKSHVQLWKMQMPTHRTRGHEYRHTIFRSRQDT